MNPRAVILIVIGLGTLPFSSQAVDDSCSTIAAIAGVSDFVFEIDEDSRAGLTPAEYCSVYRGIEAKDPERLNAALASLHERNNGLAFLKDIDFKLKAFEEEGVNTGLGFTYDYSKTGEMERYDYDPVKKVTTGTAWSFNARGNVAFDSDTNPQDFLDTRFAVTGFRDYGGVSTPAQVSDAYKQKLNDLDDAAIDLQGEALAANRRQVKQLMSQFLSTQVYFSYDLNAGLESNQDLSSRQWTYGGRLVLDAKGYGRDTALGKWNLLDYPFALLRIFSGFGGTDSFEPLGYSFPTFMIGLDQVDPAENDVRKALGEDDTYQRFKAEIHFRTPIAASGNSIIFANLDWRYWSEIDASDAIEDAGIDDFDYLTFSITSSNGVFASYSDGRLPIDLEDSQVYEIGWKLHLE